MQGRKGMGKLRGVTDEHGECDVGGPPEKRYFRPLEKSRGNTRKRVLRDRVGPSTFELVFSEYQKTTCMNRHFLSYGWQPDLPDQRDLIYSAPHVAAKALPKSVDLRSHCPAVYDQGQLGSCTANAIGGAIEFDLMKQNAPVFTPSRLFIYYNERVIENTVSSDNGAQIRDGIKTVNQQGVCNEKDWPYNTSEFSQ